VAPARTEPPDTVEALAAMRRGLLRARGSFALYVAVSNSPRRSRELIRLLEDAVPGIEIVELEPGVEDPLAAVVERAEPEASGPLMVLGLERSLSTDEETAPLLRVLNMQRERWPKALRRPVVLWVPEFVLELLGRSAPDFLDWRSGTFFFGEEEGADSHVALRSMDAILWNGGLDEGMPEVDRRRRIEELRSRLASTGETYDRVILAARRRWLDELGVHLWRLGEWAQAEYGFREAAAIAHQLDDRRNLALSYHRIGVLLQGRGEYDAALRCHEKALEVFDELSDLAGMAGSYHQLGIVAHLRGAYDEATHWYRKAFGSYEELGDADGLARSYHQLGSIAHLRGARKEALDWYQKALEIFTQMGDRAGMARSYHQLGLIAHKLGTYGEASGLYQRAQKIFEEMGDRAGLVNSYHQLGLLAQFRGAHDQALALYREALEMTEEMGDRAGAANALSQTGILWTQRGEAEKAVPHNLRSLALRRELGVPEEGIDLHWLRRQRDLLGEARFWEIVEREGTIERNRLARLLDEPEQSEAQPTASSATPPAA
jgi:tetratricopeptide (TPR) repeat protein